MIQENIAQRMLIFLKELSDNNNRDWFNSHKEEFNALKEEYMNLIDYLISRLSQMDERIKGVSAKDCIFRIYRDTRFHDKTPYKNHMGAYIAKGGRKSIEAGYYLHLEPGASFIAGGIWCPEPHLLRKLRQMVYENGEELHQIMNKKEFASLYPQFYGETMKRLPLQYAKKEFAYPELLKRKDYTVSAYLDDSYFSQTGWIDECLKGFELTYPLNRYLNSIFEE